MEKNKVIGCSRCSGRGKVMIEYYKSRKEPHVETCSKCNGTGRMVRVIVISEIPLSRLNTAALNTICETNKDR